ncbi:MAG TPA: PAS domain S-box protein, partial [Acidimicrobiales bacterium]|nr:PAS domain S-box protein [Acidimicrobiales bacterium]
MAYAATAPVETRLVIGQAIALLSVVAVVAGARRWATLRRSWYLIALGAFGFLAAGTVISELAKANGGIPPFPSMGDGIFYSGYFCLIGGGVSLIRSRSRRRDWANFVDAAIVAAGLGLLVWAFIMAPYAQQGSLPLFDRVLSSGYSAMDLVLLGVWARLAIGPGARNTSYYLIATCFTFVLVADLLTTLTTAGAYNGFLTPIISTLGFVACGTGALHPSMARLTERDHVPTVLTKRRLALLGFALAMAPGVLAIEALTGRPVDGSTVVVGVFVLASLVLVRMVLLLRVNERKARRERILREASLVLVGATTKEEMHDGALSAVLAIIGTKAGGRASLATGFDGTMRVVASVGAGARYALGHVVDTDGLPADLAGALAERRTQAVHGTRPVDLRDTEQREGSVAMDGVSVTLLPLVSQNELRGAIVVTSDAPVAAELVESVSDFAAEVALALETAALIEDQHRRKSERRFKAMIEHSSDLLTVVGPEGTIIFASPSASRVAGVDAATLIGAEPFGNAHPEDRQTITGLLENAVRRPVGPASPVEVRVQHPDGGWRWFETIATNLTRDAEVGGIVLTSRDVTDRKAADLRLTESEARFRSLVQNSSDVVAVLDEGGVASYVSSAVDRVLGYDADVMLGRSVVDLVHADDAAAMVEVLAAAVHAGAADVQCRAEVRVRHADGSWHTLDLTVSDLRHEPSVAGLVLNARDVTDRKELEGELHFRSLHDSLTGLANRDLFADRVAHALRRRSDREDMVAVLFVDLDDFKSVNESLGHAAGDEVLKTVADRLGQCLRSADTPARLGADEFAVLVEDVYTEEQVVAL